MLGEHAVVVFPEKSTTEVYKAESHVYLLVYTFHNYQSNTTTFPFSKKKLRQLREMCES